MKSGRIGGGMFDHEFMNSYVHHSEIINTTLGWCLDAIHFPFDVATCYYKTTIWLCFRNGRWRHWWSRYFYDTIHIHSLSSVLHTSYTITPALAYLTTRDTFEPVVLTGVRVIRSASGILTR